MARVKRQFRDDIPISDLREHYSRDYIAFLAGAPEVEEEGGVIYFPDPKTGIEVTQWHRGLEDDFVPLEGEEPTITDDCYKCPGMGKPHLPRPQGDDRLYDDLLCWQCCPCGICHNEREKAQADCPDNCQDC